MGKKLPPIDQAWWEPLPLSVCFVVIALMDAVILWLASGVVSSSNDAAGNGMANAFRDGFVETGAWFAAFLMLLFVVIRHRGVRITLTVLLMPAILFSLLLLQ